MPFPTRQTALAALALTAGLALPAAAGAHPSVYEADARLVPSGAPNPPAEGDLQTQRRYVFVNHGYAAVFRETNGVTTMGALNFARIPGAYRNQAAKTANFKQAWYAEAATGVQVHATCQGAPALSSLEAIGSWQGADPFYGYVPFQKTAAGFDDDPADWIGVVKTLTGVDLATVTDPAAACAGIGGTYTPADAFNTPPTAANPLAPWTALSSATIAAERDRATAPLQAQVDALSTERDALAGDKAALTDRVRDLEQQVASLQTAKAAAEQATKQAEALAGTMADKAAAAEQAAAAQTRAASTPLGLGLATARFTVQDLAKGLAVTISGPAGERAHVRAVVSPQTRRAHRLALRTIASADTTIAAGGTAVTLTPAKAVAASLAKLGGPTAIAIDVSAGGRTVRTTATLTR